MKIGKAPVLLKKAVTLCRSTSGVLVARLLVLATLRRRMDMVGVIAHKIHALMVSADQVKARGDSCQKIEKMSAIHGGEIVDLRLQLAMFDQQENGASGSPDWTLHPIFNDQNNCYYGEDYEEVGHEASVMDVIRSKRELEGLEFNMDDEVDQAAEMFIRKFRERLNTSFQ